MVTVTSLTYGRRSHRSASSTMRSAPPREIVPCRSEPPVPVRGAVHSWRLGGDCLVDDLFLDAFRRLGGLGPLGQDGDSDQGDEQEQRATDDEGEVVACGQRVRPRSGRPSVGAVEVRRARGGDRDQSRQAIAAMTWVAYRTGWARSPCSPSSGG
jgi:hypothetical protein